MSYSNKENVNILTSLLVAHGVCHAVVCPGSRNVPIVHNLGECPDIRCHPVTDERSAGFYALGMAQALGAPVAVCVTSGSALLNLAPAVAEAYYQHVPLVVISADRPQAWIDQLDGQTLPQAGVFGRFAACSVTLPEPVDNTGRWHCNRLVNEALLSACGMAGSDDVYVDGRDIFAGNPVHINVPITEPLFEFTVARLPEERVIRKIDSGCDVSRCCEAIVRKLVAAHRPMLVVGQHPDCIMMAEAVRAISRCVTVIHEPLSPGGGGVHFDEVIGRMSNAEGYEPDFILYAGDTLVSKRFKKFIRSIVGAETWAVSPDGCVHDTFMNMSAVIPAHAGLLLPRLAMLLCDNNEWMYPDSVRTFRETWNKALDRANHRARDFTPFYSQMMAVKLFESYVGDNQSCSACVHYANSSAVRLANIYARHYIHVNRGVNGIEGSLSTASGYSVVSGRMTYCVIGDLSFFYDSNALWNTELRGNLRILLLNNSCGGIFHQLPGLGRSDIRDRYVAASHNTNAHGICEAYGVEYLSACDEAGLRDAMERFMSCDETDRPMLLEVFTNPEDDAAAMKEYFSA